jgi:hypothetical protein
VPAEAGVAHRKGQSGIHASNVRIEANCSQMSSLASVFNENRRRMCTLLHVWLSVYSSMANRIDPLSLRNLYSLLDCHHREKLLSAEFAKNIRGARRKASASSPSLWLFLTCLRVEQRRLLFINHSALHHEADVLQRCNVLERIAGDRNHVGEISRLQRSDLAIPAEQLCTVQQIGLQNCQR